MRENEFKLRQMERSGLSTVSEGSRRNISRMIKQGYSKKAIKTIYGLTYGDLKIISQNY